MSISRVFGLYNKALNAYPLITQCSTTGFLLGAGDIIAQQLIERQKEHNWVRTAKFGVFGLCFVGPILRNWFIILEKLYGSKGKWTPLKKVATDQTLFAPCFQMSCLITLGVMNGNNWSQIKKSIEKDYYDIMIANWKLWPIVQSVNFYLIPLNYRLPVVALVSLFWNIYYTWKLGEKKEIESNI